MTVRELADKMLKIDVDELVRQSVIANEKRIVALNVSQMREGKNTEGQVLGVYASKSYAAFKKQIGGRAPFRVVDLRLTGAFQQGMILLVEDKEYHLESTDDKAPELAGKYEKIFGLTKESQEMAKVFNTRKLGELFKKASGL
jgi:hypothetical protein